MLITDFFMSMIPIRFHWDSGNAWLSVPRTDYERYCRRRPIASSNSKIDSKSGTLFLDADTDGKAFVEAYARALDLDLFASLACPAVRARLGIAECCDGPVSVIRTLPSIMKRRPKLAAGRR